MNYLAHLLLSDGTPELMLGNLLGDFRKGLQIDRYSFAIRQGITLHQHIDIYTDSHPIVRQSKQQIRPPYRRFAGILLDVFYDHCLSVHWSQYSPVPLREFVDRAYDILLDHQAILPDRLQQALPYMIRQDWLCSYGDLEGVQITLQRIARRLRRETVLAQGITELQTHYAELEAGFHRFFPALQEYVSTLPGESSRSHRP